MEQITKFNNFNTKNVTLSEPKLNKYGGKSVFVNYNNKQLTLQTPRMFLPYGLNEYDVKDSSGNPTGKKEYSLRLSFKDWDTEGSDTNLFLKRMQDFNDTLVDYGVKNSVKWFKKKHSKEIVEALNANVIQYSKDKETGEVTNDWPPTLKAKLYQRNDEFTCEVYNKKREVVDFRRNVVKGAWVQGLMTCSGVWFAGGKFGVTWVMRQMIVEPPARLTGFSFIMDDDETDAQVNTQVEETDEETENEEVHEEAEEDTVQQLVDIIEDVPEKKATRKKPARKRRTKKSESESQCETNQ